MQLKGYIAVNFGIIGIVVFVFLYSAFINFSTEVNPKHCVHEELSGKPCPTCGTLSAFSAVIHFKYSLAKHIQPNGILFFIFGVIQILVRILFLVILHRGLLSQKLIFSFDISTSFLLFFILFRNILPQVLYIFYKMMLTGIH